MSEWDVTRPSSGGPPQDPTQAMPPSGDVGSTPTDITGPVPTQAMPPGGAPPVVPPAPPGGSGPFDPTPPPDPWYKRPGPLFAVGTVAAALLFFLIALFLWLGDDGDDSITTGTSSTTSTSSTSSTSTTRPATTTTSSTTSTSSTTTTTTTTIPTATTTSSTSTTTTTTTTTVPETTVPPTTQPPATTTTTTTIVVTVPPRPDVTTWDVIVASPDLVEVRDLIQIARLVPKYDGPGPFTLLAPSNEAIRLLEAAPGGADLLSDPDQVEQLLLRHTLTTEESEADIFAVTQITAESGDVLTIDAAAQTISLGNATSIVVPDVVASNGTLHVVDTVLLP